MVSSSKSEDFSKLFQSSKKELHSEKFYDAMDMDTEDLKDYDNTCSEIKVKVVNEGIIQLCKKYLRFLAKSKSWSRANSGDIISLLLNYWLYDKLTHIYPDAKNYEIDLGFGALQMIWSTFDSRGIERSYYEKCAPDWRMVNHTDWEKRKKLNDYYVDFDTLFGSGKMIDDLCQVYYKKIEEMIPVCTYFEEECSKTGTYSCPDNFRKCQEKIIKSELENFPCHNKIKGRGGYSPEDSATYSLPVPPMESPAPEDESSMPKDTTEIQGTPPSPESSDIKTKVTHSVLGAAPVLFTATMLYRYTPLGPWIRRLRGGRTNSINTIDTFSHYTPETGEMFSDDPANYISYQPM